MSQGPVFIGGLAHSGKTLLRQTLSVQPHLLISRQSKMWHRFFNQFGDLSQTQNLNRCLDAMMQNKQVSALAPGADRIRREFLEGPPSYARLFSLFYIHQAERREKTRWGVQLGFIERLTDPILAAFPDGKMIQMIRDPRDRNTAVKAKTQHRRGKTGWSTACWIYSAGLAWRNQKRYPDQYLVVRFESLLARPEETLRQICEFLEEAYLPEMATVVETGETAVSTTSAISKQEVVFTQTVARRQMLAFGYQPIMPDLSLRDHLQLYLVDWPANWMSMAFWSLFRARAVGKYVRS